MTWGFEKAKVEVSRKDIPSHKSHRSESPKVLANEAMICLSVPAQNKATRKHYFLQVQLMLVLHKTLDLSMKATS
jgi:hypothetical protein